MDPVARLARDAAYVVIGLGVLRFQRAQVRRREVRKRLESFLSDLSHGGAPVVDNGTKGGVEGDLGPPAGSRPQAG